MKVNGFTKVCLVLLVIVGGLLALNWPFQHQQPLQAVGVVHQVVEQSKNAPNVLGTLGVGAFLVVFLIILLALVIISRKAR